MTVREAHEQGYRDWDISYFRGYVSRKTNTDNQPVKVAGGRRKGQLYYEAPSFLSTKYALRVYITKE